MIRQTRIRAGDYSLVVLHKLAHSLCGYDVASGRELFHLPTNRFPHELCLAPDRRRLYVTEYGLRGVESEGAGGTTIGVFDLPALSRVSTITTNGYERPHGIAAHVSGKLFVTSETAGKLLIFDLATEALLHAVDTGQSLPHITGVAPDGLTVYAANIGSNSLTAIAVEAGTVRQQIPVLKRPEGMVFSPDGGLLYVVNRESDAIAIVDTAAQRMVGQIPTGKGPVRIVITPDGERLAFPLFFADAVQVANTSTQQVTQTILVGRQPAGTTMSRDGRLLFVSCELERAVYVVSLDAYEVVTKIPTDGGAPLWVTTLSIAGQLIYNLEASRYTLYTGEPIMTGKFRTLPGPLFWLGLYLILDLGAILPYQIANFATTVAAVWMGRIPGPDNIFGILVVYFAIGVFFLSVAKPLWLIVVYGNLGNLALGVSCWHTLWVNSTLRPRELRPGWFSRAALFLAGAYFLALAILTLVLVTR